MNDIYEEIYGLSVERTDDGSILLETQEFGVDATIRLFFVETDGKVTVLRKEREDGLNILWTSWSRRTVRRIENFSYIRVKVVNLDYGIKEERVISL